MCHLLDLISVYDCSDIVNQWPIISKLKYHFSFTMPEFGSYRKCLILSSHEAKACRYTIHVCANSNLLEI